MLIDIGAQSENGKALAGLATLPRLSLFRLSLESIICGKCQYKIIFNGVVLWLDKINTV